MPTRTTDIENILSQIKQLDYAERISILEKIVALIKNETAGKKTVKLSSINGLGSEI